MPSNPLRWLFIAVAVSVAVGSVGCSRFIDGKKKEEQVIELSDSKFEGLKDLPETLKRFTSGDATPDEIEKNLGTLEESLVYFRKRTKGTGGDAYSVEDLRKFFGKYFLKENNVSPELAKALMKLKKALFGGSADSLTKAELDRMVQTLGLLRGEFVKLTPHMPILLFQRDRAAVKAQDISAAVGQARATLHLLLENLDLSRSDYSFQDTQDVFGGLADFIEGGTKSVALYSKIRDWFPVVTAVKVTLFGDHAGLNGLREWKGAIETLADLDDLMLRYHYLMKGSLASTPDDVRTTLGFGEQFLRIVLNCHQMTKTGRIPFAQVDRLIYLIEQNGLAKLPLTAKTISDTYKKVLINMFDAARKGDMNGADSIERTHVLAVRREFHLFRLNQAFIDMLPWAKDGVLTIDAIKTAAPGFAKDAFVTALTDDAVERAGLDAGFAKFKGLLAKPRPVAFDSKGRVLILEVPERTPRTWNSLLRFNFMHALTRGMMLGYGENADPAKGGVTAAKIVKWYDDFALIGAEIKAFDPRSKNAGTRSFQEASFFTFSGDGNERIDMDEMFEFVSFLFAGGLGNVEQLRQLLIDQGCSVAQNDIFELPMYNEACVKDRLRREFGGVFANLPGLVRFVGGLNDAGWERFYSNWIAASRTSDARAGLIETADLRTGTMIFHYSESLFAGFDTNRSQGLSIEEVEAAAPRFMPFLRQVMVDRGYGALTYDSVVREAFVVLVFRGQIPDAGALASFQADRALRNLGLKDIPDVDRSQIFLVFSNLKAQLSASPAKTVSTK